MYLQTLYTCVYAQFLQYDEKMHRRNTDLVVEPDIRKSHLHQPLKHGHFQVEVFS